MNDYQGEVNGIRLRIWEDAGDGEAIVFLHFGGGNLRMWDGVIPYFEEKYRLILLDLHGHGKSDSPQSGYHVDQMAADVAGVMEN